MDRLKLLAVINGQWQVTYLHSNMNGLKLALQNVYRCLFEIYIPI